MYFKIAYCRTPSDASHHDEAAMFSGWRVRRSSWRLAGGEDYA
jgi:hypothetical protein